MRAVQRDDQVVEDQVVAEAERVVVEENVMAEEASIGLQDN